jgi:hypothetical protein
VGKNVTGTTIGKTFGVASLLTGQLTLLVNQTDTFSLLVYMLESPKLTPFTIQLNQAVNWVLVAHSYNSSYSGGRDQEDHNTKPAMSK